ncbi:hypothetical protein [Labilithrix luteola]|uniref:hypothetical protein n=1 Tax=Labilithrix luteola TaxID=1391654 RepID=UPI0011BA8FEB|nr:hypothetical protein [Labilithrix luteola]
MRSVLVGAWIGGAALVSACGTDPEPVTVLCTDFRVGADLSDAEFGVGKALEPSYVAFAQAAGDLAATAAMTLREVGSSCRGLAVDLGADAKDGRLAGLVEPDLSKTWCAMAVERFALVRPKLEAAHYDVKVVLPRCAVDVDYQTTCEARCKTDASCVEASNEERCPVANREGLCPGLCTGTCQGAETAPAMCEGFCAGTCFGTCGDDDASRGTRCEQTCTGTCNAGCEARDGKGMQCDARCTGGCSAALVAAVCTADLLPPRCAGDVDCQRSCKASAAARASCSGGSFDVLVDPEARKDASLARVLGAMERHLPALFVAARGRAKLLSDDASDLVDSAGNILARTEEIGQKGAACGVLIGQTGDVASKSLKTAIDGAQKVAAVVADDPAP